MEPICSLILADITNTHIRWEMCTVLSWYVFLRPADELVCKCFAEIVTRNTWWAKRFQVPIKNLLHIQYNDGHIFVTVGNM